MPNVIRRAIIGGPHLHYRLIAITNRCCVDDLVRRDASKRRIARIYLPKIVEQLDLMSRIRYQRCQVYIARVVKRSHIEILRVIVGR